MYELLQLRVVFYYTTRIVTSDSHDIDIIYFTYLNTYGVENQRFQGGDIKMKYR